VLFRRRASEDTESEPSLLRSGIYRLRDLGDDEELKSFKGTGSAYSFWGAVKITSILTLLLWWLPVFGQMVAGYVGGRRAGSPWKAVIASLIPVLAIFLIMLSFDAGLLPSTYNGMSIDPRAITGASTGVPFVDPYLAFLFTYIQAFMGTINSILLLKLDSYIVTVAFAYIGGFVAQQTRRELLFVAEHGGSRTNIVVGRDMEPDRAPLRARAMRRPSRSHSSRGFADMESLDGDALIEEQAEERQAHATRRRLAESANEDTHSRRGIESRLKSMEKDQKRVEHKVKQRSSATSGLVARSGKRPPVRSMAAPSDQGDAGGDFEYI